MIRPGMTLLELVVALTVTGLVLVAGYGAFASAVDHRERAAGATDAVTGAAAVRRSVVAWLSGARLEAGGGGPNFRGIDGVRGGRPADRLSFATGARTPVGRGGVVRLFIDHDSATAERGLTAAFADVTGLSVERIELVPEAVGLEIRYLYGLRGERRWLPSWISSSVLPAGLRLTLVAAEGDSVPPLLRLPIVVALDGGR